VSSRVWVVSELYYPEETSTGHFMTRIAEGLAKSQPVSVLCSQPTYAARDIRAPWREIHNGVEIERCAGTRLNKNVLPLRVINLITISTSIYLKCLLRLRRGDKVVVVTNPPLLPFLVSLACRLRGARCVLRIDDVYPEVLVATGIASPRSLVVRAMHHATSRLYRGVARIVVLGRDMRELARAKLTDSGERVVVIPNWADLDEVAPRPKSENALLRELGISDKFVVQCAGNMGRAQGIENMFAAAEILKDREDIHFVFIGSGAKRPWMESEVESKQMRNITLVDQRPRSDQINFLNACDVAIASLVPGMVGVSVPSRMYNIMAAGKPVIAVTEPGSEFARVVEEEDIGWIVPPNDPEKLAEAIVDAASDPARLRGMSERARAAAEAKYSEECAVRAYAELLRDLDGVAEPSPVRGAR
jgi:colanic acid biosynthesis glycosyl transferase WcaI